MDPGRAPLTLRRPPRWLRALLAAAPVVFLVVFYAWPFATLVHRVVDWSVVSRTLHRPGLGAIAWFTLWQAIVSTLATVVAGLPVAWLIGTWDFRGRRLVQAIVTAPFLLPTVVVGAAFVALLPDSWRGTATAIVLAHVFFNIAVVARVVGTTWSQLPPNLSDAARTLGASPWRTFREVALPLLAPAILAAAGIVFLFTFTSFGVVQILGGPGRATIEVEVARRALQLGDVGGAAVLAVLQLVVLAALIAWSVRAQRAQVRVATQRSPRRRPRTWRQRTVVGLTAAAAVAGAAVPISVLALASFRPGGHWSTTAWRTLRHPQVRPGVSFGVNPFDAIATSLRAMVLATIVSVVLGGLAAAAIAAAGRGGRLLDIGTMLPLGTSAVTIGLGMLITFDHSPVDWRAEPWLVPLGHALVAVPFVVRAALPALRARPEGWIDAAATLGASPARAWWHVDARLLRRPLVVGAGFAAAISLGEFGATTFLSRTGHDTITIAIAKLLGRAGDVPRAQGMALATMLAVVTALVILAVDVLQGDA